jgi:hypothetical protein
VVAGLQVASTGVVVDAKDAAARAFYKKYGFIELPKIDKRLFLPIATIDQLFHKKKKRQRWCSFGPHISEASRSNY